MPKKKAAKKAAPEMPPPEPKLLPLEEVCTADFPCEASVEKARELYKQYGAKFVAAVAKQKDAIPLSYLVKVVEPTLKGRPPKPKAHKSIKDRTKEA